MISSFVAEWYLLPIGHHPYEEQQAESRAVGSMNRMVQITAKQLAREG